MNHRMHDPIRAIVVMILVAVVVLIAVHLNTYP
jgi:hypothetical protein